MGAQKELQEGRVVVEGQSLLPLTSHARKSCGEANPTGHTLLSPQWYIQPMVPMCNSQHQVASLQLTSVQGTPCQAWLSLGGLCLCVPDSSLRRRLKDFIGVR